MGWNFRKSVKILPGVRLNFGKKGLASTSFGPRGAKVNVGKKGVFLNTGIPGTGLSYRQKIGNYQSLYWYCPKCYLGSQASSHFCGSCGTPRPLQTPADNKSKFIIIGVILAGVVFLCVVIGLTSNTPRPVANIQPRPAIVPLAAIPSPTPPANIKKGVKASPKVKAAEPTHYASQVIPRGVYGPKQSGYITGPRGGCYYMNSNGKKTYVSRSMCD